MEGGNYNYEYDNGYSNREPQNTNYYNNHNYVPSDNEAAYNQTYEHNNNFDYEQYDPQEESGTATGFGFSGKKQFKEDGPNDPNDSYQSRDDMKDRNDTMTAPEVPNQFDD